MALDPRIPLMGNQLEVQQVQNNRLAQLAQQDMQKQKLAMDKEAQGQQMQMSQEQLEQQKFNNLEARAQSRIKSTVIAAAELNSYLEGGDVEGARAFLQARKKNLMKRAASGEDIDTQETDHALQSLDKDPETLKKQVGNALRFGQTIGLLDKPTNKDGFSLSPGQKRYDAQGNLIAEAPPPQGGMVASTDPVTGEVTYGATRKLSATDQKEIYEASDTIQNANAAKGTLEKAQNIGNTGAQPYSGVGAGARASLARLPDWLVPDFIADKERGAATTEYSTLVNEQALSNLKAIFGGNPTEGERNILLEMQAISDYTPEEQKRIINNAIQAADRRIQFNQGKIKSIQTGDYGALGTTPQQNAQPTQNAQPAGGIKFLGFEGEN